MPRRRPPRPSHAAARPAARGFGLVEIMVGIAIGLLGLLIVYQSLALSEGYKRTTTAGNDAQSIGMIASFLLAQDIGNGGNTIAEGADETSACPDTGDFATTLRPVPVLLRDGGADDASDQIMVNYGVNPVLVTPVRSVALASPGNDIVVQSPIGWQADQMFLIVNKTANRCEAGRVQQVVVDPAPWVTAATGIIGLRPTTPLAQNYVQGPTRVISLGATPQKIRFDMASDVLRRQELIAGGAPAPLAANIVLMKAQYGIDNSVPPDGAIDQWVSARDAPWREADVLAAPLQQLRRIKAVRFALVVRSAQFEREFDAEGRSAATTGSITGSFTTTLFPCNGLPGCTGEIPAVVLAGTQGFRYRVFEQVVPLRNQIWNP